MTWINSLVFGLRSCGLCYEFRRDSGGEELFKKCSLNTHSISCVQEFAGVRSFGVLDEFLGRGGKILRVVMSSLSLSTSILFNAVPMMLRSALER